jgi:alanyl-tRNA synthetase
MKSAEIRSQFLKFFESRGHRIVRSSPLVPANDPTLLFANAGMNQFKDVFLGREKRDYSRACSSQKCVRAGGKHNDLEQVGRTRRHHTFFEMLGNFSFGDYFKKDAIAWAWELVTSPDWFGIPKDKLYATVFREDDEAEELWAKIVPRDRIFRFDEKDNFWQMGETGPCGPCSEIHYDMGPEASDLGHKDCKFPCPDDCGRYVEIWNLVFMQYDRVSIQKQVNAADGFEDHELAKQKFVETDFRLLPLPNPCVDTGAGLERLAAVLQGKTSNFDTDLFRPIIDEAAELANKEYGENHDTDVSLRIIADHARAATFLIADGVLPSNEGRGYVLRLIMRRALYHGRKLGLNEPFLFKMSGHVAEMMKSAYPDLAQAAHHVAKAIRAEEERYAKTTERALDEADMRRLWASTERGPFEAPFRDFQKASSFPSPPKFWDLHGAAPSGRSPASADFVFGFLGDDAFQLQDTFGLKPDFLEDVAKNYQVRPADFGITTPPGTDPSALLWPKVDRVGAEMQMQRQRERARASWKGAEKKIVAPAYQKLAEQQKTVFDGYAQVTSDDCKIVALVEGAESVSQVKPGTNVEIVLDHTPFYAESGGQVGDIGHLLAPDSSSEVAHITDTYRPVTGVIAHKAVARETLHVGDVVTTVVDAERRDAIRRNHTATHLLHAALRSELGTHVKQAGSLVAPDRLRFDFSHYAPLAEQDVLDIEDLVNEHILKNEEVRTEVMELDAAVNSGAMALFGEKYADQVRVLTIDDFSKELCGGTHVRRTGDIGLFKIVSEGSVAAGTRRIEAVTGTGVLEHLRKADGTLAALGGTLRAKPEELVDAAEKLAQSEKQLRKQIEAQQMKRAASAAGDLLEHARDVKGVRVVASRVDVTDRAAMRQMVDTLRPKLGSGVIVLGSVADGKAAIIVGVTQDLTAKLDAGKIVREAAKLIEGSGGGRKDLAEAGGKNPDKLEEAITAVPGIIEKML